MIAVSRTVWLLCEVVGIVTTSMFTAKQNYEKEASEMKVAAGKEASAKKLAKLMESEEMRNTIRGRLGPSPRG